MDQIKINLPETEILSQLAEEAAELAQAALKLRRAYTGINPTPVTRRAAYNALLEELADVYVCIHAMRLDDCETLSMGQRVANEKMARWAARLEEKSNHGRHKNLPALQGHGFEDH